MAGVYFADSFYWIALGNPKDAWHSRVFAWEQAHAGAQFVTTEEVLTEVLNWFAGTGPVGRVRVSAIIRNILSDDSTRVLPQASSDFLAALVLYEARPDKDYSLTDCRSMQAMLNLGMTDVLTNDHHFTQEGFTILFPTP